MSSSGWDIARAKIHSTTGFSGTNDNKYILPLSIHQCDLSLQLHTNAKVLSYLLRPENSYRCAEQDPKQNFDAETLLQLVKLDPSIRVIIDVGAQVLEWKNVEFAHTWLELIPSLKAQTVVFFNNQNELTVLSRDGITTLLMVSPFAKQMNQCLTYLDEFHTRGTNRKMPTDYRAAVTLGPGLTKDQLVQGMAPPLQILFSLLMCKACMPMRKLKKANRSCFVDHWKSNAKFFTITGKSNIVLFK